MADQDYEYSQDPIESGIVPARTPSPDPNDSQPDDSVYSGEQSPPARSLSPDSQQGHPGVYPSDYSPQEQADFPEIAVTPEGHTDFPVRESSPESQARFPIVPDPLPEEPSYSPRNHTPKEPSYPPRRIFADDQRSPPNTPSPDNQPTYPTGRLTPGDQPSYPPRNNKTPERHPSFPRKNHTPDGYRSFPRRNHTSDGPASFPVSTPTSDGAPPVAARSLSSPDGVGTLPNRSLSTLAGHDEDKLSNKNTVLSYRTDRTTYDKDAQLKARKFYRSALTHLLCGLYALVLIVLGLVFSISSCLTAEKRTLEDSLYLQVFLLYIFTVSLLFLCYLHCCLLRYRKPRSTGSLRRVNLVSNNQIDQHDKCSTDYNHEADITSTLSKEKRSRSRSHSDFEDVLDTLSHAVSAVTFEAEGINFYLRLGALAFGTGSMIHDGFRIASLFIDGEFSLACRGPLYVAVSGAHMFFTFFQTFYIFKSHKIVINKHKAFVRFGFMHMVATNICTWCITTVTETAEDLRSSNPEHTMFVEPNNTMESNLSRAMPRTDCITAYLASLAFTASPYLYPCTIEYSLIAAGVLYKMYSNVGSVAKHTIGALEDGTQIRMDCHKANKGLFIGILVAVLTLIAVSCFFVFDQKVYDYEAGSLIFFGTEIILLFLACSVVVVGFARMQKLRYSHDSESTQLDMVLLIVGFLGICFLNAFIIISAVSHLLPFDLMSLLSLVTAGLAFFQSFLQTIFIMDALRRCARSEHHVHTKPGRAIVTFLLLCNLSLWVVNTFEVQKGESIPVHIEYYGFLSWSMISHLCIPLIIFFRFHSTVCLSDIWVNAYKLRKKEH